MNNSNQTLTPNYMKNDPLLQYLSVGITLGPLEKAFERPNTLNKYILKCRLALCAWDHSNECGHFKKKKKKEVKLVSWREAY